MLSEDERAVLIFIVQFYDRHGRSPKRGEVEQAVGAFGLSDHIKRLVGRLYLRLSDDRKQVVPTLEGKRVVAHYLNTPEPAPEPPAPLPLHAYEASANRNAQQVLHLHDHWLKRQGGWAPKIGGNLSALENQRTVAFLRSEPLPGPV